MITATNTQGGCGDATYCDGTQGKCCDTASEKCNQVAAAVVAECCTAAGDCSSNVETCGPGTTNCVSFSFEFGFLINP